MKNENLPFITEDELKLRCAKGDHTLSQFQENRAVARIPYDVPNLFGKGTSLDSYYLTVPLRYCVGCKKTFLVQEPIVIGEFKPNEETKKA